jgi:recombinational DNA repair protein RecT
MEADPESLVQPKTSAPVQQKLPEKKVEKRAEPKVMAKKPVLETSDFKIETTTVSPEMMKALAGDDDEEKPAPPKAPEPSKAPEPPKV